MCQTSADKPLPKTPKLISKSDLSKRTSAGETLVVINQKVYDLTKWLPLHPGGELAIKHMTGKDCTDAMTVLHPPSVMLRIHQFYIGDLKDSKPNPISQDFLKLHEKLGEMGLYTSTPFFYFREVCKFGMLWATVLYLVIAQKSDFGYLMAALLLGFMWHQIAFVAHDAGHSGVSHNRAFDTLYGMFLANVVGGLSIGWWKHSHYVHHIITNDPEHDPDIQHLPFFAVSTRFVKGLYSTFHERTLIFDKFAEFFVTRQHYLYYFVLSFGRYNLYVQSWKHVLFHKFVPFRRLEILGQLLYWIWFPWMLSYLPSAYHIMMFFFVSHVVTTILHIQITLSHFGMSTEEPTDHEETFAEKALRTSMDVDCPRWLDWFHGGLQFQVEHHLFPRLPRHHLRLAQPLVKAFAKTHSLNFYSYTFTKSNIFVLGQMKDVADQISVILNPNVSHIKSE